MATKYPKKKPVKKAEKKHSAALEILLYTKELRKGLTTMPDGSPFGETASERAAKDKAKAAKAAKAKAKAAKAKKAAPKRAAPKKVPVKKQAPAPSNKKKKKKIDHSKGPVMYATSGKKRRTTIIS